MTDESSFDGKRLNKYLAFELGISRREADVCIEKGRVTINGAVAALGTRVQPGDAITVDGKKLGQAAQFEYLAFHKPVGYVSSRRSQGETPTLYSLLPKEYHSLKTVGRLDKNSSGLLILTNDGDFTFKMTHPKFHKIKVYKIGISESLSPLHQQMIADYGLQLEDGVSKLGLERLSDSNRTDWKITMQEGRNRQIRRTFQALGYEVTKLHRIQFGNFSLGSMKPGEYKPVTLE